MRTAGASVRLQIVVLACVAFLCAEADAGGPRPIEAEPQQELLKAIGESNRGNLELLQSVKLEYSYVHASGMDENGVPSDVVKKVGTYAFSGNREYSLDQIPVNGFSLAYVRNGNQARAAMPGTPRLLTMGRSDNHRIRKGTPNPWEIVLDGIAQRIDRLDASDGIITDVATATLDDGTSVVRVTLERQQSEAAGGNIVVYNIDFATAKRYTPVRLFGKSFTSDRSQVIGAGLGEVTQILEYEIGGTKMFLPASYRESAMVADRPSYERTYVVDASTVQINPQLPDELFVMEIRPEDQVMNLDLDLELRNPFGREVILPEAINAVSGAVGGAVADTGTTQVSKCPASQPSAIVARLPGTATQHCVSDIAMVVLAVTIACGIVLLIRIKRSRNYHR